MPKPQHPPSLRWPKTKLTFYTWWTVQTSILSIISLASLINGIISPLSGGAKPPLQDPTQPTEPQTHEKLLTWVLGIAVPLANLALLYYLLIKLRVVVAEVADRSGYRSLPGSDSRRVRWYGFKSAMAAEKFLLSERKGAAVLLAATMAWVPTVGVSTLTIMMMAMFLGNGIGGFIVLLGLLVGGLGLVGHLVYVWGRSMKVAVMGPKNGRGLEEEEGEDEEDGERLLPRGGEGLAAALH